MNDRFKTCPICHGSCELSGYDYDTERPVDSPCFACDGKGFIDLYKKTHKPRITIDEAIKMVEKTFERK